jgi:hypothetical protein
VAAHWQSAGAAVELQPSCLHLSVVRWLLAMPCMLVTAGLNSVLFFVLVYMGCQLAD